MVDDDPDWIGTQAAWDDAIAAGKSGIELVYDDEFCARFGQEVFELFMSEAREMIAARINAQRRRRLERDIAELEQRRGEWLLVMRQKWPARGPNAKGWGEFLKEQGLTQRQAHRLMERARR